MFATFLRSFYSSFFFFIIGYTSPVYAIPPPETLIFLGGGIVYPGLLISGIFLILLKYVWIKTKLYLLWRQYFAKYIGMLFVLTLLIVFFPTQWIIKNQPINEQNLAKWQQSSNPPALIDLRDEDSYKRLHVAGAIHFPAGKGLANHLTHHPDKKNILYCEVGHRSSTLNWLNTDLSSLKKTLADNRLFYFPGGVRQLIAIKSPNPLPININLPPEYAHYLLKDPRFIEVKWFNNNLNKGISDYKQAIAAHKITIITHDSTISSDAIVKQLSDIPTGETPQTLNNTVRYFYFTTSNQVQMYPFNLLITIIIVLSTVLVLSRRRALFHHLFTESSTYFKWNILTNLLTTIVILPFGLFTLPIPFDIYLYKMTSELPMNISYLIGLYTLAGLVCLGHLGYPNQKRFEWLQATIKATFVKKTPPNLLSKPRLRDLLISGGIIYALYFIATPLSTIAIISLMLLIPLLVDLFLYVSIRQYKNASNQWLILLKRCGYPCNPDGTPYVQLNTCNEGSIGRINALVGEKSFHLGLFSGKILDDKDATAPLAHYSMLIRNLLVFIQQDIELCLDKNDKIVSLQLLSTNLNSRVLSRHILLQHAHSRSTPVNEKRFSSTLYEELFINPTPLMLDILQCRWSKNGGCIKSLYKLGLLSTYQDKFKEQFIAFSNKIYLDEAFEKAIFSTHNWFIGLRKKITSLTIQLAIDSIAEDYDTLILPKSRLRLTKLHDVLNQTMTNYQLVRVVQRALTTLCKESALWQSYSSLLHQEAFRQLQEEAKRQSFDVAYLMNHAQYFRFPDQLPSRYELVANTPSFNVINQSSHTKQYTATQRAFFRTEYVRTQLQTLQLQEWQLIALLLEKLQHQLKFPVNLNYLTINDFPLLLNNRSKLLNILHDRANSWHLQNQWQFPDTFSLEDTEKYSIEITQEPANTSSQAIRVAGNQSTLTGNAVLYKESLLLETLPNDSVLIASNLRPEQLIACQSIKGVLLHKGSYLSHTSIIARELNIPLIAQFPISTIKENDKLLIQQENQVSVLSNEILGWEFLSKAVSDPTVGNKAQRLALISQKKYTIPASVILKHHSVEYIYNSITNTKDNRLEDECYQALTQLFNVLYLENHPIIVRSSTNVEDSKHHSYAGLFYSQPNINSVDELIAAICASWKNVIDVSEVIQEYSGETELSLNLILQSYIRGQLGGVLFTQSSKPGWMHLEIAPGGSEGVTEGNAILSSVYINQRGESINLLDQEPVLSAPEFQRFYQLGLELEALFGAPQDIEWILIDNTVYILQSRDLFKNH